MVKQNQCSTVFLIFLALIGVFLSVIWVWVQDTTTTNPDIDLTTPQTIAKYGYPAESHTIVTEDGYILTVHRIPYGKNSPTRNNRPPVLLLHGLLCSSVDWVLMGPDKSLGYILADAGYDVWLGNARGNLWSSKHVSLSPASMKFWEFSWQEMGVYDLPAIIDYMLKKTGQGKLFFIGHSMGSSMFYAMTSERPEYNQKIRLMVSLAPAAHMSQTNCLVLKLFAAAGKEIEWFTSLVGSHQMFPSTWFSRFIAQVICADGAMGQSICSEIYFRLAGYNVKELNLTTLPVLVAHTPAGASVRTFVHFGQTINAGVFQKFCYGEENNIAVYGTPTPPKYDWKKITAPTIVVYGQNDMITDAQDVAQTKEMLPNVVAYLKVKDEEWNHFDFLWGIHAKSLVYNDIIKLMNKY